MTLALLPATLLLVGQATKPTAYPVTVGNPPPKLQVETWIKGKPVDITSKGVYVVDFWATWCQPCIKSFPDLSKLQQKHKGKLTVVGIDVWEPDRTTVADFVKKKGDVMDYTVAQEVGPDDPKQIALGKMATTWLDGSGTSQIGIPRLFVIKDGIIQWIGEPFGEFDKIIAQIVDGTWNIDRARVEHETLMSKWKASEPFVPKLAAARKAKDYRSIIAACEGILAVDSNVFGRFMYEKFSALINLNNEKAAYSYGREVLAGSAKDQPDVLNRIAWLVVDPARKLESRDLRLAVDCAERAKHLTGGKDHSVLHTLARAYFASGEKQRAIDTGKEALRYSPEADKAVLQKALDEFIAGG